MDYSDEDMFEAEIDMCECDFYEPDEFGKISFCLICQAEYETAAEEAEIEEAIALQCEVKRCNVSALKSKAITKKWIRDLAKCRRNRSHEAAIATSPASLGEIDALFAFLDEITE